MEQKKPTRITYLFGAGASVGNGQLLNQPNPSGVPIVENFKHDLSAFFDKMHSTNRNYNHSNDSNDGTQTFLEELYREKIMVLSSVYDKFKFMYSFDTFAKSLFEKESDELYYLKILLESYIVYRQLYAEPDPRYDLLIATLIKNKELPSHVNFLSWNYDTQIEMSITRFTGFDNKNIKRVIDFGVNSKTEIYSSNKPHLLKLNGSISKYKNSDRLDHITHRIDYIKQPDKCFEVVKRIMDFHLSNKLMKYDGELYFSWEEKGDYQKAIEKSISILNITNILIIIGYSFPTLNRKVDKALLEALTTASKIYIQCGSEKDYEEIVSKIGALCPKHKRQRFGHEYDSWYNIEYIPQNKEFYVPFEFEND